MHERADHQWSSRKLTLTVLAIVVLGAFVIAVSFRRDDGPTYEGRPLRYWVVRLDEEGPSDSEVARVIASAGVEAVPFLMKLSLQPDSLMARGRKKLTRYIPALDSLLPQNTSTRDKAHWAFSIIGPKCIPALVEYYNSGDEAIRIQAVRALHSYVAESPEALEVTLRAARDESDMVRLTVALSLAQFAYLLGTDKEAVIPEPVFLCMAEMAFDKARHVPDIAVHCLGKFGSKASPAIPRLLVHLKSKDAKVRRAATNALHAIDPDQFK